jgi:tRNA U34 5-carboxymethylaminomethyl modifying enzyme MnmG/GidA
MTLGQASRIDGVRAGDLAVLSVHVKRWRAASGASPA